MRAAISFLSLAAFGLLLAGVFIVAGSNPGQDASIGLEMFTRGAGEDGSGLHLGSLMIGLMLGLVLSALARVSWSELPRRFAGWLIRYERSFYRIALAGVLVAVLVFY